MTLHAKHSVIVTMVILASSIVKIPLHQWAHNWEGSVWRRSWWKLTVWFMPIQLLRSQALNTQLTGKDVGSTEPHTIGSGMESASKWNIRSWVSTTEVAVGTAPLVVWEEPVLTSSCWWFTAHGGLTFSSTTAPMVWVRHGPRRVFRCAPALVPWTG